MTHTPKCEIIRNKFEIRISKFFAVSAREFRNDALGFTQFHSPLVEEVDIFLRDRRVLV
jgi:hypothetical protein